MAAQPDSALTAGRTAAAGNRIVWNQWLAAWDAAEAWEFEFMDEEFAVFVRLHCELLRRGVTFDERFNQLMRSMCRSCGELNGTYDC